ncbi:condensin complex subunit 1 [Teleopsis dalmanni]|uniref:condensin complex subunit 1 n=1 Tax=Teleopsis dalmanni TaxID=139649 RepID=UPI0018CDE58C|nr:condensin complex subunit 1 [Teleopsis dalmanni]
MNFSFSLPLKSSDLLNSSGDNYYVKHVYTSDEIPDKLKECRECLHKDDPFYILDHFDTYYSVMECESSDISAMKNLSRSFDMLYLTVDKLGKELSAKLSKDNNAFPERSNYLTLSKMLLYLFTHTMKRIEVVITNRQRELNVNAVKKRGKHHEAQDHQFDWDKKRGQFLVQMFNILQLPLEKLWMPPVVDSNFVEMITERCYNTISSIPMRADNKNVIDSSFQIIGVAIKRYSHAISFPVQILYILSRTEHTASSIAHGIALLNEECGINTAFSVLIKDITDTLTGESTDTAVSRNFSNFLIELAARSPELMIPHLSNLSEELLNCESHVIRNCILQIMGDAIVGKLTSEELPEEMKEARDDFLDLLLSHICDVSAHVRAKVLNIWHNLKQENAVPLSLQIKVLCETVDRLEDKTAIVRKQAIQLIKAFLECNPFAANLSLEELIKKHEDEAKNMNELKATLAEEREKTEQIEEQWNIILPEIVPLIDENLQLQSTQEYETQESLEDLVKGICQLLLDKKYKEAIILLRKVDYVHGNSELRYTLPLEEQVTYYVALFKTYIFLANGCKNDNEKLDTMIKTVKFLEDSIEFSKVLTRAVPKILDMLLSKTISDVCEAVDLFTTGYLFGVKGMEAGMQRMLLLVWSSEKEKRDFVSNAYKKVLFTTDLTGRAHAVKVIQNLSRFIQTIEYGHFLALECLIEEWVSTDDMDALIIQVLFEIFTMKIEGTTTEESCLALELLVMCSSSKPSIASANLNIIEMVGLGERGRRNPRLYAKCLQFMMNSIDHTANSKYYQRYDCDSPIATNVFDMFMKFFFHPLLPDFELVATKTFEFFYTLCQKPDIICQKMIVDLMGRMLKSIKKTTVNPSSLPSASQSMSSQPLLPSQNKEYKTMKAFLLTRFVYIIGYITLKELIFLDVDVYNNMKYIQELEDCELKKKEHSALRKNGNLNMSATESLKRLSGSAAEPQQEPDEDLVGATAEDNIAELINEICEERLLFDKKSLLRVMVKLVLRICQHPSKFKEEHLQRAATLTLVRFMCVSSKFCHSYMQLLMNILNKTKDTVIKSNIVIGLSDLTFRFPNEIEPWTGHLYLTLQEQNEEVRLTSVKMISHLILHEMIRVKGQIAELAKCIVDPSDDIKNMTRQFFKEISTKSNILYNVLPDIISNLGDINTKLPEEKYRTIMKYIIGLIHKDRQVETLVEKLSMRFQVSHAERQWRDTAYCLSLLTYNEKTIRKLIDNIHLIKDKVQVDEVYQSFKLIISNTSKLAKPELKTVVTELESRINECLEVRDEGDEGGENNVNNVDHGSNKLKSQTSQKTTTRKKRAVRRKDSSDDENMSLSESDNEVPTKTKNANSKSTKKPQNVLESSSSDRSESEEELPGRGKNAKQQAASRPTTSKNRGKIVEDTTTSSDDSHPKKRQKRLDRR